jgi:RNA polymerase sigma-70 factor (ECF subfamily)
MAMTVTAESDPERAMIQAIGRGDRHAFEEFVRRQNRWIRGVIFSVIGDPDAADDVAQQVWVATWNRIRELRDPGRWRTWLYRLTRNAAIDAGRDATRRRAFNARVEADPPSETASPARRLMQSEQQHVVLEAIRSLPALYREPFVLKHLQNWSYREIAQTMGIPADTVETRLVRARRMLRETLAGKI